MELVVVMPAYNEADVIADAIAAVRTVADELADAGIKLRIYVVNDGSTDGTGAVAADAGADRVLRHHGNRGLGAAVRTGLAAARDDGAGIVVKFDADLQHDPRDIVAMVQPILDDEADIVYGNRFKGLEYRMPPVRKLGNRVFTWLMRRLTGWPVRDAQPGILALSASYLVQFRLPGDYNYTQQVLLDGYHKGMRFAHVPVRFRQRETGSSFVSLRYPVKVMSQIVMALIGLRPLRVFGTVGLLFLGVAAGVLAWDVIQWLRGSYAKPATHVNAILGFSFFGLQTAFFGMLAQLVINQTTR